MTLAREGILSVTGRGLCLTSVVRDEVTGMRQKQNNQCKYRQITSSALSRVSSHMDEVESKASNPYKWTSGSMRSGVFATLIAGFEPTRPFHLWSSGFNSDVKLLDQRAFR